MYSEDNNYISMGKPIGIPFLIPVKHDSTPTCINESFMVDGEVYKVTCVSFKTPHGVVFVNDVENMDIMPLGSSLESHVLFPNGASVVFVEVTNKNQVKARLWQRDEGELPYTQEAVCIAMVASKMLQKVEQEVEVFMGKNKFRVKWDNLDDDVYLANS